MMNFLLLMFMGFIAATCHAVSGETSADAPWTFYYYEEHASGFNSINRHMFLLPLPSERSLVSRQVVRGLYLRFDNYAYQRQRINPGIGIVDVSTLNQGVIVANAIALWPEATANVVETQPVQFQASFWFNHLMTEGYVNQMRRSMRGDPQNELHAVKGGKISEQTGRAIRITSYGADESALIQTQIGLLVAAGLITKEYAREMQRALRGSTICSGLFNRK